MRDSFIRFSRRAGDAWSVRGESTRRERWSNRRSRSDLEEFVAPKYRGLVDRLPRHRRAYKPADQAVPSSPTDHFRGGGPTARAGEKRPSRCGGSKTTFDTPFCSCDWPPHAAPYRPLTGPPGQSLLGNDPGGLLTRRAASNRAEAGRSWAFTSYNPTSLPLTTLTKLYQRPCDTRRDPT